MSVAFHSNKHKGKKFHNLLSLSSPSSLHSIGQPEMKGNYSCVLMWMEDAFLYFYTLFISAYMWEGHKKEPLAQGHTVRDALNTHGDMLSASMLARMHEHTCTHSTRMHSGWLLWGQSFAVLSSFIQGSYMCVVSARHHSAEMSCSLATGFRRMGSFLQKCSPSLPLSLS